MKDITFEDIEFEGTGYAIFDRGNYTFEHGYGVSILDFRKQGHAFLADFEIGILKDGNLTYDTPLTDDVIRCYSVEEVNEIINKVQNILLEF